MVQPRLELLTYQFFSYKWSLHNNQSSVVDQSYNHKVSMCDSLPSKLPTMTFNNIEIRRENSIKFLGVIIDENLTWKNHTEVVENKSSISPSFTFTSIMLILLGIVLLKLNSRES